MTSTTASTVRASHRSRVRWSTDLASVLASGVCALITWLVVAKAADVHLAVKVGAQVRHVGGADVAFASVVVALAGFLVLRLLERVTAAAIRIWSVLAVVVALLSMLAPLGAVTRAATMALLSLHAVVATVVITAARRSRR